MITGRKRKEALARGAEAGVSSMHQVPSSAYLDALRITGEANTPAFCLWHFRREREKKGGGERRGMKSVRDCITSGICILTYG